MPTIYSRFMEKEAREWRQIYKALTLLEYLIKHGSERVVDDARAHNSTIKMLRNFHYIDDKGKDQGINGEHLGPAKRPPAAASAAPPVYVVAALASVQPMAQGVRALHSRGAPYRSTDAWEGPAPRAGPCPRHTPIPRPR